MIRNNLNRKENIKRANDFVKSIKKYPSELIRINYEFDAFTSYYERISQREIDFMIENILNTIRKILGKNSQKVGVAMFPDFDWDADQFLHKVGISLILVGKNLESTLLQFKLEVSKLVDGKFGGEFKIEYIKENSPEDIFIEAFPVQFEAVLRDADWFFTSSKYPKFYSRPLFEFLTSPLTIFHIENGSSEKNNNP